MLLIYELQLAVFEALRRLGFQPDDIFVAYNYGEPVTVLRTQGKQFVMNYPHAGEVPANTEEYNRGWHEACQAWNATMSDADRARIYEERFVAQGESVPLLEALKRKGITWAVGTGLN